MISVSKSGETPIRIEIECKDNGFPNKVVALRVFGVQIDAIFLNKVLYYIRR